MVVQIVGNGLMSPEAVRQRRSHPFRFPALSFFIWFLLIALVSVSAQTPRPESFKDLAQDGEGVVWAINSRLFLFNGKEWSVVPSPFPADDKTNAGPAPLRFTRMQDGSLACVWKLPGDLIGVSSHTGATSRVIGQCAGKVQGNTLKSPLFADSHNRLWITDAKPDIYRADGAGGLSLVYSIKPEQLVDSNARATSYDPLYATEDGRGRVWIWSNSWAGSMLGGALRGVLVFDGDNVKQQEAFEGIEGKRFTCIDRKDDKHMWVSVLMDGIFEVDIDTMKATPLPEAEPGAFRWVKKIFSVGDDLFVISNSGNDTFRNLLWRRRDGKWTRLIDNTDANTGSSQNFRPSVLSFGKDFLLCTFGSAPWYVRPDGPPERLDWRNRFPVEDAWKVFRLVDGSLVALGGRGQPWHGKVDLPPKPSADIKARATELRFKHVWKIDSNDAIWTIFSGKEKILSQWDGAHWVDHPFPPEIGGIHPADIAPDTKGRIWFLPLDDTDMAEFFDSKAGTWQVFPTLERAYVSLENDRPEFVGDPPAYLAPEYTADLKQITFLTRNWEVSWFDGATWRKFKRADIQPGGDHSAAIGRPFFGKSGRLCVNISEKTWLLDGQGHWAQTEHEEKLQDRYDNGMTLPTQAKIELPPGCITTTPDSVAADNQGACWLTWQEKLYKCGYGACVEVLAKDEPDPFADGRKITGVWIDRQGNAFLKTGFEKQVMIAPKSPLPKATVAVEKVDGDSATVRLGAGSSGEIQFRWRLDAGPWQLTKEKTVTLDSLPNGLHVLSATAVDAELQTGAQVTAKFKVKIDQEKQIAALIQQLSDPDFAKRKAAVAALARQPAPALSALKAARDKVGDDLRWWIDVAIQEIESQSAKGQSTPAN
ncbi:MAG: HEAT repeat domain-containing protein [Chthoniobacteraceae bacterium]